MAHLHLVPAPPPPPHPVSCGNQAPTPCTTPFPQCAAIPITDPPIQETSHSPSEAQHFAQGAEAPPNSLVQNGAEKGHPAQETNPAPQALSDPQIQVQQDEQDTQMNPSGQDHVV